MRRLIFVCCALLALVGCQSAYYSAMEKAGIHKRDILVDRVEEWESELKQYSNASLKAASAKELSRTRAEYRTLLQRMKAAEQRIEPVLSVLRDQVLFLKHNLNARAISALHGEYRTLQGNVDLLMADMQRAIDEADTFVRNLQQNS